MNRIWNVSLQELVANFKRRSYLLMTFGVPALAIIVVLAITLFKADDEPEDPFADLPDEPIGYVDHSGLFGDPGDFGAYLIRYESQATAQDDARSGRLSCYYLIPEDYLETGQITRVSPQFNIAASDMALFESFLLTELLGEDSPLLLARLQSPAVVHEHQLDRSGELVTEIKGDSFANFGLVYGFALIMMVTMFFSSTQLMRSVITEKENRMIEIVLSSLRPIQLLAGKVLGQGLAGLVQILTWLGGVLLLIRLTGSDIPFVGEIELPPSLFAIAVLYYLGGYLLFAAFSAGIGAISINLREGPQYSMVFTLPAVLPLMFLSNILEAPNSTVAVALSFFPLSAPLGMIERLAITIVPGWQIVLSLVVLFGSVGAGLWLAARLFRVNTLLSGQVPTRNELLRMLVQG